MDTNDALLQILIPQMRFFLSAGNFAAAQALHRTVERDLALIIFMHALADAANAPRHGCGSLGTVLSISSDARLSTSTIT